MKNIFKIKNLAFAITLIFVHSYDISAQTYPLSSNTSAYTDYDNYLINKDKSTNTARLSLFTNSFANGTSNIDNNNRDFNINLSNGAWNDPGQKLLTIILNPNSGDLHQGSIRGNVGIGTTTPTEALHVNGAGRFTNLKLNGNTRFAANGNGLVWGNTDLSTGFHSHILDNGDLNIFTDDRIYFGKLNSDGSLGATTLFADVHTGNIGIGTTSPTEKLHVNGNGRFTNLRLSGNTRYLHTGHGIAWGAETTEYIFSKITDDANLKILTDDVFMIGDMGAEKGEDNKSYVLVGDVDSKTIWIGANATSAFASSKKKYSLYVSKGIISENYAVGNVNSWSDYVFAKDYKLPTLKETEAFIIANKHLPNVPSEAVIKANGYNLHHMNNSLLKTIEEMTLHAIAQEKEINIMKSELAEIKALLLAKK